MRTIRHSIVPLVALAIASCASAPCPKTLDVARSLRLTKQAPTLDVAIAHSAAELGAAAKPFAESIPAPAWQGAANEPAEPAMLDSFIAETDFSTSDVAIVRAGGGRARLAGTHIAGSDLVLYFVSTCPPCGGGDPGSYERASKEHTLATKPGAELVRVHKGARVSVRMCGGGSCGSCGRDIP